MAANEVGGVFGNICNKEGKVGPTLSVFGGEGGDGIPLSIPCPRDRDGGRPELAETLC